MSLSKAFKTHMASIVTGLSDTAEINNVTNTVNFSLDKVTMPEGVTTDSLKVHVGFINDVSAAVEVSTANIAQQMFKDNDKLTTVDSTLVMCDGLTLRSQHNLRSTLGEDTFLFGNSTTVVDFIGNEDQAKWLAEAQEHNKTFAKALFK